MFDPMNRRVKQILVLVLVGGISLVVIAMVMAWATGKSGPRISLSSLGAGKIQKKDGRFVVPAYRVPKNFKARADAPAISLLPEHLPYQTGSVSPSPPVTKAIARGVGGFLSHWDTFDPAALDRGSRSSNRISAYKLGLQRWTAPQDLGAILARSDSSDPTGVCPAPGCTTGSKWMGSGNLQSAMTIVAYDGDQAYVTLYGAVRYTGDPQFDPLAGSIYFRSYALLLAQAHGRWLVTRAVAETLRPS